MNASGSSPRRHLRVAMLGCPYGDGPERIAPLGAMSVLSYAKAALGGRIETMVFDLSGAQPNDLAALAPVLAWRPDVVGVPVYTNQAAIVDRWVAVLRRELPQAILVAGGPHPTLTSESYVARRAHLFDFVVRGDGETPMAELLRRLLAGDTGREIPGMCFVEPGGSVRILPDSVPIPPEDMTDPLDVPIQHCNQPLMFTDRRTGAHRKAVALVSSRSCPLQCSFCAIIAMPGKWRAVPTDRLIGWLRDAHARDPFEHVYFMDANFFVVPTRVREIAGRFAADLPGVTWSASSTVGMLLKVADDLPALKRSGLRMVEMGIEAGSQRQLRFLNKHSTIQQNLDAVRALQRNRIDIGVDFIMFYPDQTLEDLRENLRYLRNVDLTLQEGFDHLFNSLVLYPGTPIRDLYARRWATAYDPDEMPDIAPLFVHPEVRAIYEQFGTEFRRRYLGQIEALLADLRRAGRQASGHAPDRARFFRLQAIQVQHIPFKILWELAHAAPRGSLEATVPWLRDWPRCAHALRAMIEEARAAELPGLETAIREGGTPQPAAL